MKRWLIIGFNVICGIYIASCALLYFFQEHILFHPQKLPAEYKFQFAQAFEEVSIQSNDAVLSGVLFKAPLSTGLIFYLHGNAGSIASWGNIASTYTDLGYDVFMLDYRGYGKSDGTITSEAQLFLDVQAAFNEMRKNYEANEIIILGYSIGTGPAARLASTNDASLLILQAPYYSIVDLMKTSYPILPGFILRYPIETGKYLQRCKMPVVIFHGDKDKVIYYGSSEKLKAGFKNGDKLIKLSGQGHNGITENPEYLNELRKILR